MKTIISILICFFLLGCGHKTIIKNDNETLLGFTVNYDRKEVAITVVSTGCTTKSDFSFTVAENTITVNRLKKDYCKAMPEAVSFTYTLQEAGFSADKKYVISNSFIVNPNLANIR